MKKTTLTLILICLSLSYALSASITARGNFSLALKNDTALGWGNNNRGKLGDETSLQSLLPNDFDGDGISDLAILNRSDETWHVFSIAHGMLVNGVKWGGQHSASILIGFGRSFLKIDPDTGTDSTIAMIEYYGVLANAFAVDSENGKAYITIQTSSQEIRLMTIDLNNGSTYSVPINIGQGGFGFDAYQRDHLIGYRWDGSREEIISINPVTGESERITYLDDLHYVTLDAFAVDAANHKVYLFGIRDSSPSDVIYTIDLLNRNYSITPIDTGQGGFGFSCYNGSLIGYRWNGSYEEIIRINPATGNYTLIAALDVLYIIASGGFAVDEVNHKAFLRGTTSTEGGLRLYTIDLQTGANTSIAYDADIVGIRAWEQSAPTGDPASESVWVGSADFDGDGAADMCAYNATRGEWFIRTAAGSELVKGNVFGGSDLRPVLADFDGDGKQDPAVYDENSGLWHIRSSRDGYTYQSILLGSVSYVPVCGNADGDQKADPAVFAQDVGNGFILKSGSQYESELIHIGIPGFILMLDDYDGDGRADLTLYGETGEMAGYWFIQSSATGKIHSGQFGGTGFTPVPGDYDGDGLCDPCLYQESTGIWYLLCSQSGSLAECTYGGPGYLPVTKYGSMLK